MGGFLTNTVLQKSFTIGTVEGVLQVGGLAGTGFDVVELKECYSEGTVNAAVLAGGLIGAFPFSFGAASVIDNCYSKALVNATSERAGGITGGADNALLLKNSYATGAITAPDFAGAVIGAVGGVTIENVYFDLETSGLLDGVGGFLGAPSSPDITAKTTAEMQSAETVDLLNSGSTTSPWVIDSGINEGYPVLDNFLSISENNELVSPLIIYPTLFNTQINILTSLNIQSYSLYNYAGTLIVQGTLHNTTKIEVSNLPTGLYILKFRTNRGEISRRVLKK